MWVLYLYSLPVRYNENSFAIWFAIDWLFFVSKQGGYECELRVSIYFARFGMGFLKHVKIGRTEKCSHLNMEFVLFNNLEITKREKKILSSIIDNPICCTTRVAEELFIIIKIIRGLLSDFYDIPNFVTTKYKSYVSYFSDFLVSKVSQLIFFFFFIKSCVNVKYNGTIILVPPPHK